MLTHDRVLQLHVSIRTTTLDSIVFFVSTLRVASCREPLNNYIYIIQDPPRPTDRIQFSSVVIYLNPAITGT